MQILYSRFLVLYRYNKKYQLQMTQSHKLPSTEANINCNNLQKEVFDNSKHQLQIYYILISEV